MRTITLTLSEDEANSIAVALMIAAIQFDEKAKQEKQESHDIAENFRAVCTKILWQHKEQEEQEG